MKEEKKRTTYTQCEWFVGTRKKWFYIENVIGEGCCIKTVTLIHADFKVVPLQEFTGDFTGTVGVTERS